MVINLDAVSAAVKTPIASKPTSSDYKAQQSSSPANTNNTPPSGLPVLPPTPIDNVDPKSGNIYCMIEGENPNAAPLKEKKARAHQKYCLEKFISDNNKKGSSRLLETIKSLFFIKERKKANKKMFEDQQKKKKKKKKRFLAGLLRDRK
jgi:hypothetical protein